MGDDHCEAMTTRDHLRLLWRRRWVLLGVLAICVGGAVVYVLLATPTYQARATLVVTGEQDARPSVLSAAAPLLSMLGEPVSALGGADRATQIQIIKSRPSLQAAYGLMLERRELPASLDRPGEAEALIKRLPGVLAELSPQPPPGRWPERYEALVRSLYVGPVEDSDLIEVRCEVADRELARDFVNALVLAYLGRSLADAQASTRHTRRYIADELDRVETRLAEAEEALRAFGEHAGTIVLDESARQQVGLLVRLNEQAALAESTMNARRAMRADLTERLRGIDERIEQAITVTRNPEIVQLQTALAQAEADRAGLLEEYAPESMPVRRASAGIEELRARLEATSAEVIGSRQEAVNPVAQQLLREIVVAQGEEMAARESLRVLRRAVARVEADLAGLPAEQVGLLRVRREIELLERVYLALKEREQECEIAEKTASPVSRLIEPAITPDEPVRPKRLLSLLAGVVAGLLLGLLAVGVAEHMDERLHDPERVARVLAAPVIATLQRGWQPDGAPGPVRAVLAHIRAATDEVPVRATVASVKSEGVALARALAEAAAAGGDRVVLLTADGPALGMEGAPVVGEGVTCLGVGQSALSRGGRDALDEALSGCGADLVLAAADGLEELLALGAAFAGGSPLVLCVDLHRTTAADAQRLAALAARRGMSMSGIVALGAVRNGAAYYPPADTGIR